MTVHQTFTVTNLSTGEERTFAGISPAAAVVNAYEQAKGNNNTWAYDYSQAKVSKSGGTVSCGDWTAILSKDKIMAQIRASKKKARAPRKARLSR